MKYCEILLAHTKTPHNTTSEYQIDILNLKNTFWHRKKKSDYFWTRVYNSACTFICRFDQKSCTTELSYECVWCTFREDLNLERSNLGNPIWLVSFFSVKTKSHSQPASSWGTNCCFSLGVGMCEVILKMIMTLTNFVTIFCPNISYWLTHQHIILKGFIFQATAISASKLYQYTSWTISGLILGLTK